MFLIQTIVVLAGFALLAVCFWIKLRLWASADHDAAQWTGKSIDVAGIKPKVDEVRRDHLAATRQHAKGGCFHSALVGLARRAVARLAYFRNREPEEHVHAHDP